MTSIIGARGTVRRLGANRLRRGKSQIENANIAQNAAVAVCFGATTVGIARRWWPVLAVALSLSVPFSPAYAEVQGKPDAIATVHAVVEAVGGREKWANARSFYAELRGYPSSNPSSGLEQVWTDFQQPDVHFRFEIDGDVTYRVTRANCGWQLQNGVFSEMDGDVVRDFAEFWARSEYVLYHRLARGDPTLRVEKGNDDRLEFYDVNSGEALGWFQINARNEVVKWRATFGDDAVIEYVFGPFAQFGDIRMPRWGAQTGGGFRFENVRFELSGASPPVSFDPN